MNRFNKIILLVLLSVVTGAASVKAMGGQFAAVKIGGVESKFMAMPNPNEIHREAAFANATLAGATKFISIGVAGSHEHIDMDRATAEVIATLLNKFNNTDVVCVYPSYHQLVRTFAEIRPEDMQKIATIYACWIIKNGGFHPVDGKVNLNGQEIQLTEEQNTLVKSYFVKANEALLNVEPKIEEAASTAKVSKGFVSRNKGKIAAISTATILGLAAAYVYYGNSYYDANCTADSTSIPCTATMPANYAAEVAATAATFISAAAGKFGEDAKQKFYAFYQRYISAQQTMSYPNCSQFDRPEVCSLSEQPIAPQIMPQPNCSQFDRPAVCSLGEQTVAHAGFFKGLLWPFLR